MKTSITIMALLVLILAGCQSATALSPTAAPSATAYPTYTPLPPLDTLTPYPTYTKGPTQTAVVIVVTATGPLYTLTPTTAPTKTPIPSPTVEPINTKDKTEGVYLVGEEVAPGNWRASGDCYAVTQDKNGDQLDMTTGNRSIIMVPPTAYSVKFVSYPGNCTWSYLGP